MNKIEKLLEHNLEVAHTFTILEVVLFELCMFAFGLIIITFFPQVLTINIWITGLITILGTIYMLFSYITKNNKLADRIHSKGLLIHLTEKFGILDWTIYKFTIIFFAIFITQLFPSILDIPFAILMFIFAFGLGYFVKKIYIN